MNKIIGTELRQELTSLAMEIEGMSLMPISDDRPARQGALGAAHGYLNDRAASIYAGANEVQRNIVAGTYLRTWQSAG